MLNPGVKAFATVNIPAAGSNIVSNDKIENLSGVQALTWFVNFQWGSGGTSVTVYLQTSFDQGTSWCDVAAVQFTTANEVRLFNIAAMTNSANIAPSDGTLTIDTVASGIALGDRFRLKYTVVGTYAGSSFKSHITAR